MARMTGTVRGAVAAAAVALAGAGCAAAMGGGTGATSVPVFDASGRQVAQLSIVTAQGGMALTLSAAGLPAGVKGVHLHAVGRCDAPDFTTAGPHLNPTGRQHGRENPQGPHLGDLPNLTVGADGRGTLTGIVEGTLAEGGVIRDGDGTAIVVHAAADDNRTDPSGNSGARIACGVIAPPRS